MSGTCVSRLVIYEKLFSGTENNEEYVSVSTLLRNNSEA